MTNDAGPGLIPESCSLPIAEQPLRVSEFDRLFTDSVLEATRVSAIRLDLVLTPAAVAGARDLADREVDCCSFFRFHFTVGAATVMSIAVPQTHTAVLDALVDRVAAAIDARAAHHDPGSAT